MAEINVERKPAGNYAPILAALSVLLIAGFLWWLGANSEPTSTTVVMEDDTAEVDDDRLDVTLAQIEAGAAGYVGQEVEVDDLRVASRMGSHAFWTTLPSEQPFLIKLDSALVGAGEGVSSGETLTVRGTVHAMSDSVLNAWEQSGALADEVERAEAEFARHFLEASRIRRARGN